MTKLISTILLFIAIGLFSCDEDSKQESLIQNSNQNTNTISSMNVKDDSIITHWARWRRSSGCDVRGGGCMIAISNEEAKMLRGNEKSVIKFKLLNDSALLASYVNVVDFKNEKFMYFQKNTTLESNICEQLYKKEITILSGEYKLDFESNKFGDAILKVITK